ncbi:MAG: rod shape-determining protein MreD [Acidobacteria bacterium]|nr:rod shape-determining protein MreD [Acidobacteriota bacterium]
MASAGRFVGALAAVALVEMLLGGLLPEVAETVGLFVLLVVLNSVRGDSLRGLAGGLAAGLVQDVVTSSVLGLHGVACCVVGYGAARVSQRILTTQRVVTLALIATGVLVHQVIVIGLIAILEIALFNPSAIAVLLRVVLTTAVGLVVLWVTDQMRGWMEKRTKGRTLETGRPRWFRGGRLR